MASAPHPPWVSPDGIWSRQLMITGTWLGVQIIPFCANAG